MSEDNLETLSGWIMEDMDPGQHVDLYTTFVNRTSLKDSDRQNLKKERGFTDETIDLLKFKSCCPDNAAIILGMLGEFSEEEMLSAGLLKASEQGIKPTGQLLGTYNKNKEFVNNILIPYFDEENRISFLRPHKYGLEGKGINIYAPVKKISGGRASTWIITESEFKAAAAIQYGYPAIGLPGIHSFSGYHFDRLKSFIEAHSQIERLVVVYDNEIKNNKLFKNYKPDVRKQWDTQWRAVQMARVLPKTIPSLKSVTVGVLPSEWMVDGKIDIDGALAQGRQADAFRAVVMNSLSGEEYIRRLPAVALKIVQNKIYQEEFLNNTIVKRENNSYWIRRVIKAKQEEIGHSWDKVCNFVMEIKKTMLEDYDHIREIYFIGENGSSSRAHICKSGAHILREFKTWVGSCGNFVFTGSQEDLDRIWEYEYALCDGRKIMRPHEIGHIRGEESRVWLFGNSMIKEDGSILTPDEDGVIWDGLTGYQPQSIVETDKEEGKPGKLPTVDVDFAERPFGLPELREVADKMYKIYNNKAIYLAMGWVVACLLSEEIYRKYSCFPILFIGGKRECGKTTLGNWLMAMAGFTEGSAASIGNATFAGVEKNLAWFASLPFWLDEFRNNKDVKKWEGFLRNSYQRQSAVKGTINKTIKKYGVNAGIILSGEETPEDNALLSRCMIIPLTGRKIDNQNIYAEIAELRAQGILSRLVYEVIKRKTDTLPYILASIDGWKKRMMDNGVGDRIALNYSISAACYDAYFLRGDPTDKRREFVDWVTKDAHRTEVEKESEHMLSVFMEDVVTLHEHLEGFYCIYPDDKVDKGKRRIALHFPTFYNKWTETYRRTGHEQFKRQTMLSYIKEEPYFIEDSKLKKVDGKAMRCLILSLDPADRPPDGLLTLADGKIPQAPENQDGRVLSDEDTPF